MPKRVNLSIVSREFDINVSDSGESLERSNTTSNLQTPSSEIMPVNSANSYSLTLNPPVQDASGREIVEHSIESEHASSSTLTTTTATSPNSHPENQFPRVTEERDVGRVKRPLRNRGRKGRILAHSRIRRRPARVSIKRTRPFNFTARRMRQLLRRKLLLAHEQPWINDGLLFIRNTNRPQDGYNLFNVESSIEPASNFGNYALYFLTPPTSELYDCPTLFLPNLQPLLQENSDFQVNQTALFEDQHLLSSHHSSDRENNESQNDETENRSPVLTLDYTQPIPVVIGMGSRHPTEDYVSPYTGAETWPNSQNMPNSLPTTICQQPPSVGSDCLTNNSPNQNINPATAPTQSVPTDAFSYLPPSVYKLISDQHQVKETLNVATANERSPVSVDHTQEIHNPTISKIVQEPSNANISAQQLTQVHLNMRYHEIIGSGTIEITPKKCVRQQRVALYRNMTQYIDPLTSEEARSGEEKQEACNINHAWTQSSGCLPGCSSTTTHKSEEVRPEEGSQVASSNIDEAERQAPGFLPRYTTALLHKPFKKRFKIRNIDDSPAIEPSTSEVEQSKQDSHVTFSSNLSEFEERGRINHIDNRNNSSALGKTMSITHPSIINKMKVNNEERRTYPVSTGSSPSREGGELPFQIRCTIPLNDSIRKMLKVESESEEMSLTTSSASWPTELEEDSLMLQYRLGRTYLQKHSCTELSMLIMCKDCKSSTSSPRNEVLPLILQDFCRFYGFRKIKNQNGIFHSAGFLNPNIDPKKDDIKLWYDPEMRCTMDLVLAKQIITRLGDHLCYLLQNEFQALNYHLSNGAVPNWKRTVPLVRETCDQCKCTIFNHHWICHLCGFSICVECFVLWSACIINLENEFASCDINHVPECLQITQIAPSTTLKLMNAYLHEIRATMKQRCLCARSAAAEQEEDEKSSDEECSGGYFGLTSLLNSSTTRDPYDPFDQISATLIGNDHRTTQLEYFVRPERRIDIRYFESDFRIRTMTLNESKLSYPDVDHVWHCGGTFLRLLEPNNIKNLEIFQEQWIKSQPVIISNVNQNLNDFIWNKISFMGECSRQKVNIFNCVTKSISSDFMEVFWNGFDCLDSREKVECGRNTIFRIQWPDIQSVKDTMPLRYYDIMTGLPIKEYTHLEGRLNTMSYLPQHYLTPFQGPMISFAYGTVGHPDVGSVNLQIDIADSVNVLVNVCKPVDDDQTESDILKAVKECDLLIRERVKKNVPGALWHIYHPHDSDKIRDFLNKISGETGDTQSVQYDPIHSAHWYLNGTLRERLFNEYGVRGSTVIQFLGDAFFIPAGSPYQVKNFYSCINATVNFVSVEHIGYTFQLNEDILDISNTETHNEDLIQIKQLLYHTVKEALNVYQQNTISHNE